MFGRLRQFYRPADKAERHEDRPQRAGRAGGGADPAALARAGDGAGGDDPRRDAPGAELPELLADAAELREMLTNLIFNAVDAMPQGGTLRSRPAWNRSTDVCDRSQPLAAAPARARWGPPDDAVVVLEVADTGAGMNEETRRRCLEPFFTTKGQQGTGLGLAMVYGTMQRHGGSIDLDSAPGRGRRSASCCRWGVNRNRSPPGGGGRHAAPAHPDGGRPAMLNEILVEYLAEDRHTVEMAGGGEGPGEVPRAAV